MSYVTESDDNEWPAYLLAAMKAAGYERASDLSRETSINESLISRWLRGAVQPSIPQLRRLAPALKLPILTLAVKAGHFSVKEAQMKDAPKPPEPGRGDQIEQEIRDAGYPPEVEKALLKMRQDNQEQLRETIATLRASGLLKGSK